MKTFYEIRDHHLVTIESGPAPIRLYRCPDAAERQELIETYDLDAHTLDSTLDIDEIPRVEFEADHVFIIWKKPNNLALGEDLVFGLSSLGILLRRDQIVLITSDSHDLLSSRALQKVGSSSELMLKLLLETVHHYMGHIKGIKLLSTDIQKKINDSMENRYLLQMFNLSETLIYYLDAIEGNAMVLSKLRTACITQKVAVSPDELDMLEDIVIDNQQCAKQAEIYSSVLSGLMDARGNIINNNMNVLLKNLTLINVIFLPMNLIASIGGMSEYSMMTQGMHWWQAYTLFILGMAAVGWVTWILLHRKIHFIQKIKHKPR